MILPDGRLELVFHLGEPPLARDVRQPSALIAGRMVEALELDASHMDTLGIRLRPETAGAVIPSHLLAHVESMDAVLGPQVHRARERMGNAQNDAARVEIVWTWLRSMIGERVEPDTAIAHSVRLIEASHGCGPVEHFIPHGLGTRQWERRFARSTGFTPKAFARITRLQHVITLYESGRRRWAELAIEAGFYDQAHLTNEFRAFTGQSPQAYFHAGRGMPEFYRDGFFQYATVNPNIEF